MQLVSYYSLMKKWMIIMLLSGDYESPESDSVSITPGPTIIWFTDADDRQIISLSHDGLHEIDRLTVTGYPWDVIIHPRDRSIWFSDVLFGFIYRISGDEWKAYTPEDGWWEPLDIELDERRDRFVGGG